MASRTYRSRRIGTGVIGLGILLSLTASACSEPPPPAPEPTGDDLDRAWRVAVGEDPLDQTVAEVYAQAMNAHETPAVVVEADETDAESTADLAAQLSLQEGAAGAESDDDGTADHAEYDVVISRALPFAEALNSEAFAEMAAEEEEEDSDAEDEAEDEGDGAEEETAEEADDLVELIETELEGAPGAEAGEPAEATLSHALVTSSITAELYGIDDDDDSAAEELAADCQELTIGVREELDEPEEALQRAYGCEPEELIQGSEEELIEQLITAEIDAAVITSTHPEIAENALLGLQDAEEAFARDQYIPVVSADVAEELPDVVEEISESLDTEALLTLRRLTSGEQALSADEAAEYWLIEEEMIATPEDWG